MQIKTIMRYASHLLGWLLVRKQKPSAVQNAERVEALCQWKGDGMVVIPEIIKK